ncbi:hypothetical protein [Bradyrhizobium barranii]
MPEYTDELLGGVHIAAGCLNEKIRFITIDPRKNLSKIIRISVIYDLVELREVHKNRALGSAMYKAPIAPAFVPVRAPSPSPTRSAGAIAVCATERSCAGRLTASMPNGVTLSLEGGDAQLLSAVIEALGRCDVPAGV